MGWLVRLPWRLSRPYMAGVLSTGMTRLITWHQREPAFRDCYCEISIDQSQVAILCVMMTVSATTRGEKAATGVWQCYRPKQTPFARWHCEPALSALLPVGTFCRRVPEFFRRIRFDFVVFLFWLRCFHDSVKPATASAVHYSKFGPISFWINK